MTILEYCGISRNIYKIPQSLSTFRFEAIFKLGMLSFIFEVFHDGCTFLTTLYVVSSRTIFMKYTSNIHPTWVRSFLLGIEDCLFEPLATLLTSTVDIDSLVHSGSSLWVT